jgi:hypothetical protein
VKPVRVLSIIIALGLIVAVFGAGSVLAKQASNGNLGQLDASHAPAAAVAPADSEVAWAASDGEDISYVGDSATVVFFINDDALESTKAGTAEWAGFASSQGDAGNTFSIPAETVNAATTTTFTLAASDYASGTPTNTPLTAFPSVVVGGTTAVVSGANLDNGTFTLLTAAAATSTATFNYHITDSWSAADTATQRAKVISTSDPAGEFVTVSEVASIGSSTANATSQIFRGSVVLSSDAATEGTNSDGVWVQDGDTVTVNYLDSDGATVNSDTVTVDGVSPIISAVTPADGTITNINNPTIQFDVTDVGSGIKATDPASAVVIKIRTSATTTIAATAPAFQAIADGFRVLFAQGTSWLDANTGAGTGFAAVDSTAFTWEIIATDVAGNATTLTGADLDITIDLTAPDATAAETGTSFDATAETEGSDSTTTVKLTFSEDLDSATVAASDFTVAGVVPTAAVVGTSDFTAIVYLTVATLASDDKPEIKVVGSVSDLAGNALTDDTVASTDNIAPTMTNTMSHALSVVDDEVKVTVTTDEKLAVAGLIMVVLGPDGSTGVGTITTTSPTTNVNEGTVTVAAGTKTGQYGVSIQITDLGANAVNNLTAVADEVVAATDVTPGTSTTVVKVANGPIADTDFDGDVDASDITISFSTNTATSSAITLVDASAQTITVNVAVGSTETATVSYSYVATETFEVDHAAPTVTFDPVDDSTVENQSPFIRLTFDEDEYAGDTFTTVTLTKADLTNPDGTTTDLLASFVTSDSIEFIWAASGLALGDYTLTVSADDTAGNSLTDSASDFTIAERADYDVALRPGWNLVSLPGAPANSAINTVVANTDVSTVLTYDPTVPGGWSSAVRDSSGSLAGTLTDITGSTALWVYTSSFEPISVDIPGISAGATQVLPSYKLAKGYNMVPVVSLDHSATTIDADNYLTGLDWSRVYGYDNTTSKFVSILPATTDTLTVGQGYWVFLDEVGTLVP